jgi:peroxiredoxin Q/BCP
MSLKLPTAATYFATLTCLLLGASTGMLVPNAQAQTATNKTIAAGDKAPDFALPSEEGKNVKPSDFKGKVLVIFFYDKDSSPVTEQESTRIKKTYKKLKLANADVLGIGTDPVAAHKAMKTNLDLQYHLLTDKDDSVRKMYGLPTNASGARGRYGVVVDKTGVVKKVAGGEQGMSDEDWNGMLDYIGSMAGNAGI